MKLSSLAELAFLQPGMSFRSKIVSNEQGNAFVVQSKDLTHDGGICEDGLIRTFLEGVKESVVLTKGDVLLSVRGRFAAAVIEDVFEDIWVASSSVCILRVRKRSNLSSEFLALYLNSAVMQRTFSRLTECSTIPALNLAHLSEIQLPVPTMHEQRKLVAIWEGQRRFSELMKRKSHLVQEILDARCTLLQEASR